jgi:hypothetical protein
MPSFKSTFNILKTPWEDEVFNPNWLDSDKLVLPPNPSWDYNRDMIIEDVDIWEVLYEAGGGIGVYASWCPHAEFYLLTSGIKSKNQNPLYADERIIETFYGVGAQRKVLARCQTLGIPLTINDVWVDEKDLWLYQ